MEGQMRIKSAKDLEKRQKAAQKARPETEQVIHLCAGAGCIASGALEVKDSLEKAFKAEGISVPIKETGCLGPCARGTVIIIKPEEVFYEGVKPEDAEQIVQLHFKQKEVVKHLT